MTKGSLSAAVQTVTTLAEKAPAAGANTCDHEGHNTHSNMTFAEYTCGWAGKGGKGGDRAHSRGRPQEEHPDGPPLFVRVLGTSLRPGGTQGGITHPCLRAYSHREGGRWDRLLRTRSATDRRGQSSTEVLKVMKC